MGERGGVMFTGRAATTTYLQDKGEKRMTRPLELLNALFGGALVLFGVLLAQQPWIEIAQPPNSDAFRLIQFHFLLTGGFVLIGLKKEMRTGVLGSFAMLLLGANLWIAYLALVSGKAQLLWPVAFAAVSGINLAYLFATDSLKEEKVKEDETAEEIGDGLIPANFGVANSGAQFRGALILLGWIALIIGLTAALFFFGSIYMTLLKAAIFDSSEISLAPIVENLKSGAGDDALARAVIAIAATIVVYGGMFLIEALVNFLLKSRQTSRGIDMDRSLTQEERVYAGESIRSLADYLDSRRYGGMWPSLYAFGVVGLILSFMAVPAGIALTERIADARLELVRAGGVEPIFYSGAIYLGGIVGGFFAGMLFFWSIIQFLGARYREFGEYLFAKAGWNSVNGRPRNPDEFLWVLVRHIRIGAIDIGKQFKPSAFLYAAFRERESLIYKSTALSVALAAVLTAADLARYEMVDESGVSYSKYFRFASRHVDLADLDRVELRCFLFSPDKKGKVNLGVSYILVKEGGFRIDLLDGAESDPARMTRLEALDARLSASGVKAGRARTAGFLQGDKPPFISSCAPEIEARYDPHIAPRLIRLLRAARP